MSKPFFASANQVISMYARRQERGSEKAPSHSMTEIHLACKTLDDIALSAAYAGHADESVEIFRLSSNWPKGKIPAFFPVESTEVPA
jgi:hypothetical protein